MPSRLPDTITRGCRYCPDDDPCDDDGDCAYYNPCESGDCDCCHDEDYCSECACSPCDCSPDGIVSYCHKPSAVPFHGSTGNPVHIPCDGDQWPYAPDDQTYLGLEIEYEAPSDGHSGIPEEWIRAGLGLVSEDGSLSFGAECKTWPMTYGALKASNVENAIQAMRDRGARAWEPGSCGLHCHVSVGAFYSRSHVWRFSKAHDVMRADFRRLAGRKHSSWARWSDDRDESWPSPEKVIALKAFSTDRYLAVNYTGGATIELRFWRGSLERGYVTGVAAITDAMVEWTATLRVADFHKGTVTWDNFRSWGRDNLSPEQNDDIQHVAVLRHLEQLDLDNENEEVSA